MRVLVVQDYASIVGGGEAETETLRAGLLARGIEVRVLASRARAGGESVATDYACYGTTGRLRTVVQAANPSAALATRRALRSFRPDVVHLRIFLTQLGPLVLPWLRAVPSVHQVVWYRPVCPRGTKLLPDGGTCRERRGMPCLRNGCLDLIEWLPLMAQLGLYERWRDAFDLVVANSEAIRSRLLAEGIAPVEVIWGGVPERGPRPPLTEPPVVAFAGRLVREKGVDLLLRAFVRVREVVPSARLLVAGEGPERAALARLARELAIDEATEFLGHLPRGELDRRFDAAWVQVLPGRWEEPFGLAAAEAMMRGTAVVASSTGGPGEFVADGETGLLTPPGDVEALAAALVRIATDRARAEDFGRAGHAFACRRLGAGRFVEAWIEVYQRLVAERRCRN